MAGTKEGGISARQTNYKKYGPDYYRVIGKKGGKAGGKGGFASTVIGKDGLTGKERARLAGKRGGKVSKRRANATS